MANNRRITEERSLDLGNFLVGRLLPFREKRTVGPFCFLDHMGPGTFGNGKWFDVDQHPHIGLCTLTYLLEGAIAHADSTGARQTITPGSVNLMASGKGVTHTERTPAELRNGPEQTLHGYQFWVALPKEMEEMEPAFFHIPAEDVPHWQEGDLELILLAGEGFGRKAPTPAWSPLFLMDIRSGFRSLLNVKDNIRGEVAVVVVKGKVWADEQEIGPGQMLISKTDDECALMLDDESRIILFGGQPFEEERFLLWNFASSRKERLKQAVEDWKNGLFPKVPGDETYIPLP